MLLRWLQDMPKKVIARRQASRGRTVHRTGRVRQLWVESLEERTVPAPVSWINAAGGDWGTTSNWSTGAVPGAADDVTINLPGSVTVTHSANVTDTIHSLVNTNTLQIAVGIVNVATFQNSGTVSIATGSMLAVNNYTQTGGQTVLNGGTVGAFLPPESTALAFNGSDQVAVPNSPSLNPAAQLTVEAWVNPSSLQNQLQGIAGTWDDLSGNNRTNLLWIQFGKFAFYVSHDGSDFPNAVSTTTVQTNQWYHVAGTFDGSDLRLYINGALEATTHSPGSLHANTSPFNVGLVNGGGGSAKSFQGQIADLSFWSVARSQSQIQSDMAHTLSGSETDLAGYWQLSAAPNGTVTDLSSNNNNGTTSDPALTGAPVTGGTISIQGGTFSGTGTINGNLSNAGEVDLGATAGVLTVRGNYTQTSAGTLALKVGGTTAGTQYDQVDVLGSATLDGTLNVALTSGFNPLHGQTFNVLSFASATGNFATVNLPTSDGVTAFTTSLGATNLTLVGATIAPTSTVSPLPTYSSPSFTVSWTGQDNPGGSGVASFDIFVSDNGGAFVPFLTGTTGKSATFNGLRGHTYGFYSVATDGIGNREATPSAAEATTTVPSQVGTTTALASSAPSGSTYGQSATFSATVSASLTVFGTPTGSVQFLVDGANLGGPVVLVGGKASLTTSALSAGKHSVTVAYTSDTTDFAASTGGPLEQDVAPALLLVSVDNQSKVYGAALPTLTGSVTGLQNNDNITASFTTSATAASGVGAYGIVATLNDPNGRLSNYTVTNQPGTLTVTPATLTVMANNASKVYGSANPTFTDSLTGFVNGDTASVVSGAASLTTTATAASGVGSYVITAAPGSLSAANYIFSFVNGTLSVTPATLTVTVNSDSKVYGSANPTFTSALTGFVNGDTASVVSGAASLTTTATAGSGVGTYVITATQVSLSAANYTFTFVSGALKVTPATLTVTANNATKVFGTLNPKLTATIKGFVNGDTSSVVSGAASLTTTATIFSHVGKYPIVASRGTLSAANYTFTFVNGTLTVTEDDDEVSLVSSADPSVYGQSVTFTATVTAHSGVVAPEGTVTFWDGNNALATVAIAAGQASFNTAALDRGSHAITAVYNGSPDVAPGTSAVLTESVDTAVLEADPLDPSKQALFVGGTKGSDHIEIESQMHGRLVEVEIHGANHFRFDQVFQSANVARIVIYGGPDDNVIEVSDDVKLPTIVFGGHSENYLKGGGGPTVLVGGGEHDILVGGRGRSILIGGGGADVLRARGTGTILIGGTTDFDGNATALASIMAEWSRTDESYAQRVSHLLGPNAGGKAGGHNGSYYLNAQTVHDDGAKNVLKGSEAMDWFFAGAHDQVKHKHHGEVVTKI
jgi:hypothetical protein